MVGAALVDAAGGADDGHRFALDVLVGLAGVRDALQQLADGQRALVLRVGVHGAQRGQLPRGFGHVVEAGDRDLTEVRSTLDSYIAQGCNVIVDFLSSMEISQAISEDCERQGVYHISIDADPSEYSYFYGLSNKEAGEALGTYLVDYVANEMGGKCDLLVLMDSPSHGEDVLQRTEIPKQMLMDAYDFINDDTVEYLSLTVYDLESIRQKLADFLTPHADRENIILISFASFCNDALYSASKSQGFDDKLHLFSYDGMDATVNIFKSGEKSITKGEVDSGFDHYGGDVLVMAQKLVAGEELPHKTYTNAQVLDANNVFELHPDR